MKHPAGIIVVALAFAMALSAPAAAQVFGTFPWQMQPYCNVVTLSLTNTPGGGWVLDGTDDQCGAANKGSAVGVASFNSSGNVSLNFTIVTAPSGKPVHVSAVVSATNGAGTWNDSVGNSGTFAFFGNTTGLPTRPIPANGIAPATITTTEIAVGTIGVTNINTAQVQARVTGACPAGQFMAGVNEDGTVVCSDTAARSGQVFSGTLSQKYVSNSLFTMIGASFPLPLPIGTPLPVLEYLAGTSTSATCPGVGQSSPGRICVYGFNTQNISSVVLAGISSADARFGFAVDIFPTTSQIEGWLLANWAYQVP